jgi:hypothetical protein
MTLGRAQTALSLVVLALAGACSSRATPEQPAPQTETAAPSGREPDSYSAVSVRTFYTGAEESSVETRIARDGGKSRQEWVEGGRRFAAIVRPDLERSFLVDLDRGVYVEHVLTPATEDESAPDGEAIEKLFHEESPGAEVEYVRAGTEVIDGHTCQVFRSRIALPAGEASEATVWEADDLGGLALRSELRGANGSRVVTDLREIHVPADPALFDLPAGARRVETVDN